MNFMLEKMTKSCTFERLFYIMIGSNVVVHAIY